MKKILSVFTVLALTALLIFSALAAEGKTVYVCDGGTGDGTSENSPLSSFQSAVNALNGKGGTIVLVGDTTRGGVTIPDQSGDLTVTAINDAKMIISGRTTMQKNINDNVYTFDMPIEVDAASGVSFEGRFNSVVFTENFTVECTKEGGSFSYYGGCLYPSDNESAVTELPYSITVHGGTFTRFLGGNLRSVSESSLGSATVLGSIAAPLTVTITGGTFGTPGDYSNALAPNKAFEAFNFSGMNILADGGTLNISGGTFHYPIYLSGRLDNVSAKASLASSLTASDKKYYANDGDIAVNISGGTFNGGAVVASYVQAGYTQLLRGNYTVNVTGGTFAENTVFDATQVKAYAGENKKAVITIADGVANVTAKRFDIVNGTEQTYDEPLRVAFIGDSITEGHSSSNWVTNSYSARYLENALASGEDVIVSNFGMSSGGIRPMAIYYYPATVAYPISLYESGADVFIFALGTNDADYTGRSSGAAQEFYDRYSTLIKEHSDRPETDRVYVTSLIPRSYRNPLTQAEVDAARRQYDLRAVTVARQLQKQIAEDLAVAEPEKYFYLDLYAMLFDMMAAETNYKDTVHPNDAGYIIMGEKVYEAVHEGKLTQDDFYMTDVYVSDNGSPFAKGTKDDPISQIQYAFDRLAPTATVHILDTISFGGHINTPRGMEKLTIVGEGEGATWNLTSTSGLSFTVGSNLKLDNFALVSAANDITIMANYHDVEITETVTTSGTVRFYAGHNVWNDRAESDLSTVMHFATAECVSSDEDVTITLNGGDYTVFSGGNRLVASNSPYGTYSGNMTINIGEGVTINEPTATAISGANYLTGTITANIASWGEAPIRETTVELTNPNYDIEKNTGKVTVNVAETVTAERIVTGDFNADGTLSVADVITALKCMLNSELGNASTHFYNVKSVSLRHVIYLIRQCIK